MTRDPEPVGEVAREWARRRGVDVAVALGIGDDATWTDIVGADLAEAGRPVSCEAGVLHLQARDRLGAARLRYSAEAVRAVCNERLGREIVRSVVVREPQRRSGRTPAAW